MVVTWFFMVTVMLCVDARLLKDPVNADIVGWLNIHQSVLGLVLERAQKECKILTTIC